MKKLEKEEKKVLIDLLYKEHARLQAAMNFSPLREEIDRFFLVKTLLKKLEKK